MSILKRFSRARNAASLLILDNIFPHPLSAFRIAEYKAYLERYDGSLAYSTAAAFSAIGENRSFAAICKDFIDEYPQFAGRVFPYESSLPEARLAYFVFLQNASNFIGKLNESNTPFAFTLYPGGGFQLNENSSDAALRHVCASPNLKKIITTQKITHEYVQDFIDRDKVEFIYGGVFPSAGHPATTRKYYQQDKDTFDICFVAFKYMRKGIDKGYDVFVSVARALERLYNDVRFHVVGPFDSSDIEVSDLKDKIHFYGVHKTPFFSDFYARMDLILAPGVPFVLLPGAFDGFPTGACIEAGLSGVPVFCTDILNQNIAFMDGEEIVIVPHDVDEVCESISHYRRNYERLMEVGRRGQQAFQREFGTESQLEKRFKILDGFLSDR